MFEYPEPRTLSRRSPERGAPGDDCARIDALLEAFVDDQLASSERSEVDGHVARCAHCAGQVSLARRVQGTLHELPAQEFPLARVPGDALAIDRQARRKPGWQRWMPTGSPRQWLAVGRSGATPAWVAAAAAALAAVLATGLFMRPATPTPGHDIVQAEAEVKLALAYLGRIGARTGNIVAKDVLEARVAAPIARSVRNVLRPSAANAKNSSR